MERLKSHRDFVAVLKRRRRVSGHDIVVHFSTRSSADPVRSSSDAMRRLGLDVSKSVGNAVTRNTVKRRFRVLARMYEHELPQDCDIIMRAKPSAAHASFSSLEKQVQHCFADISRKVSAE